MFWSIVLSSFVLMVAIIAIGQGLYEVISRHTSASPGMPSEDE